MTGNDLPKNSVDILNLGEKLFPNIVDEEEKLKIVKRLEDILEGGILAKKIVERYTGQAVLALPAYKFESSNLEAFLGRQVSLNPDDVSPNVYLEDGDPPSFHLTGEPLTLQKYYQKFVEKQQRSTNSFRDAIKHAGGIFGISFGLGGNGITGAPLLGMAIPDCSFSVFQIIPGTNPHILLTSKSDLEKSQKLANFLIRNTALTLPETSQLEEQNKVKLENNSLIINNTVVKNLSNIIHQAILRAFFVTIGGAITFTDFLLTGNLQTLPPIGIVLLQMIEEG